MSIARVTVFGAGSCPTSVDIVEMPEVQLVRSNHIVDVYRSGEIGWSQFHNSSKPYNQIDTHINALIAIRHNIRLDEEAKAQADEKARKKAEKIRNALVDAVLIQEGFSLFSGADTPARRLAERIVELEQEKQKK